MTQRTLDDYADARVVERRVAGESMAAIARDLGVSRERIRQVANQLAPWKPWDAVAIERRALRREVAEVARNRYCEVCGTAYTTVETNRWRYCSEDCGHVADVLHYHTNDERQLAQLQAAARWRMGNANYDDSPWSETYDRRLLNDPDSIDRRGRWFVEGSEPHRVALRAVAEGWPIARRLHPDLLAQLRDELDAA